MEEKTEKYAVKRSELRMKLGILYFGFRRHLFWMRHSGQFAKERRAEKLEYVQFSHATPMLRKLKDLEMQLQYNKVTNLRIAASCLDGLMLQPGETFSFWYLVRRPTRRRGFLDGMVLREGKCVPGLGGGLCQMTNLIYWMTLHTPLTVSERHRHGYDVFPDSGRTQPFATGATVFYPFVDLMIRNDTDRAFQLSLWLTDTHLCGEWRSTREPEYHYEVVETEHSMTHEYWGGYMRHNKISRNIYTPDGEFVREEFVTANDAIMLYSPFLASPNYSSEGFDK